MNKKRNWRGVSDKIAKDKTDIYNSREWKELRTMKLQQQSLCEQCIKDGEAMGIPGGYIRSATCVHHVVPIETARTKDEMRRLALDCGLNGLMSLCQSCHAKIHKELGSNTAKIVRQRAEARQDRWADNLMSKFVKQEDVDKEERQQMLKDLERESADDLWNFLQDVADGIRHPKDIKTDDQWPTL